MLVTVWDSNTDAPAVATTTRVVAIDPADLASGFTEEVVSQRVLERITDSRYALPAVTDPAIRADPAADGRRAFRPGWSILRVVDDRPEPSVGERKPDDHDGGVPDFEAGTITYTWAPVTLPEVGLKAAWAAERDRLIAEMKADAEAACEAYLSPGRTKAMRYDEKKREVILWSTEASPRVVSNYPGAQAEAAARAGLNPFDTDDLASVTETELEPVMNGYSANALPWIRIGMGIEAWEQLAGDAITEQHDLAMAAYAADPNANLSAFLAAMRAAAVVAFPAP